MRLNGSLPDAFTVAKVPKHEIICLNRYYSISRESARGPGSSKRTERSPSVTN